MTDKDHDRNEARSIDSAEFRELLAQLLDAAEEGEKANDPMLYKPARDKFIAHIDASVGQQCEAARKEFKPWYDAVTDACIVSGELPWNENDARGSLAKLIAWREDVALDPRVSDRADLARVARQRQESAAVAEGVDTALPKAFGEIDTYHDDARVTSQDGYTAEQMTTYGAQQREAGRREADLHARVIVAMALGLVISDRASFARLHEIIRDRNFTKATKFPPAAAAAPAVPVPVAPQWISVEDRLPEVGQAVAFVAKTQGAFEYLNGRVLGGKYSEGGFSMPGLVVDASHWIPLPAAPSLQQGKEGASDA